VRHAACLVNYTKMSSRAATGVTGLDDVLGGGFPRNRLYLVQGDPGVGKTTLALQFLREGVRLAERALYVTLSESREELRAVGESHGWSLDGIDVFEMSAGSRQGTSEVDENTLYVPAEVELGERMNDLLAEVDRVQPTRIVVDSCTELRLLAQSPLRFRRQLLMLKDDLVRRRCTILVLDTIAGDLLLQSLVHGVVVMEQLAPLYGAERRRLRVVKLREVKFRGGFHDMTIEAGGGVIVFPRLVAAEHHDAFAHDTVSSGIREIDDLVGGGLDRGTSTLLMGPAGCGKSSLAVQYAAAAAARGERVAIFAFDEGPGTLFARAAATGADLAPHVAAGRIRVQQIDPAEMPPGEFAHVVCRAVEDGARMVVIDSLNGYLHAMPEEHFLCAQLHELLSYLRQRGVVTIMVVAQHGLVGAMTDTIDVSYLADTVVLTRYFESDGEVHKAISVMKKRSGRHEATIRKFSLGAEGFVVSEPLRDFRGVLTGTVVPVAVDRDPDRA
jgi:circadian clock protein KaiC